MGGWYFEGIAASGRSFAFGDSWRHPDQSEEDTVNKTIGAINVGLQCRLHDLGPYFPTGQCSTSIPRIGK